MRSMSVRTEGSGNGSKNWRRRVSVRTGEGEGFACRTVSDGLAGDAVGLAVDSSSTVGDAGVLVVQGSPRIAGKTPYPQVPDLLPLHPVG